MWRRRAISLYLWLISCSQRRVGGRQAGLVGSKATTPVDNTGLCSFLVQYFYNHVSPIDIKTSNKKCAGNHQRTRVFRFI